MLITGRQTDIVEKQHGLAREEYFASHRPRIHVTRMEVSLSDKEPAQIKFIFVNKGEAEARECNWNAGFLLLDEIGGLYGNYIYSGNNQGVFNGPLPIGAGTEAIIVEKFEFDRRDYDDILNKRKFLHVIGTITFQDVLGVGRNMGFLRWFDTERRRFRVVDDPEYEYED